MRGDRVFFIRPSGKIVFLQDLFDLLLNEFCRAVSKSSGSLNRMAVAGRVLGAKNVSGSDDEKTAKIVAPSNPLASRETSLLRKGS